MRNDLDRWTMGVICCFDCFPTGRRTSFDFIDATQLPKHQPETFVAAVTDRESLRDDHIMTYAPAEEKSQQEWSRCE
jgi:hypothetical protein